MNRRGPGRFLLMTFSLAALGRGNARAQSTMPLDRLHELYNSTSTPKAFKIPLGRTLAALARQVEPTPEYILGFITKDLGGKVERSDKAAVIVPPQALAQDLDITVATASARSESDEAFMKSKMEAQGLNAAGVRVEFGPEGTQFLMPVTLILPYSPDLVAAGVDASDLKIYSWDRDKAQWQGLESTVDSKTHTVTAKTARLSLYQAFSGVPSALAPAAPASTVADVRIICSPLRFDCQPLRFQNLPAGTRLRIYSFVGELIKDLNADGSGQASWDGTNQRDQPIGGGVYFVFAEGNGTAKTFEIGIKR